MLQQLQSYNEHLQEGIKFAINPDGLLQYQFHSDDLVEGNPWGFKAFDGLYAALSEMQKPVLYWFKIEEGPSSIEIYRSFEVYTRLPMARTTPRLLKGKAQSDSRFLYVGKKHPGEIHGRFYVHLGYHPEGKWHGLQLRHWTKPLQLQLSLNILPLNLEHGFFDLSEIYERQLAKILNPLIGTH